MIQDRINFNVRVHDLRHAHASWLLAGGADLKGVMDRMGHAHIPTTQKYLHTLPDTDQRTSTPSPESKNSPSVTPPRLTLGPGDLTSGSRVMTP